VFEAERLTTGAVWSMSPVPAAWAVEELMQLAGGGLAIIMLAVFLPVGAGLYRAEGRTVHRPTYWPPRAW
jgi:hypothetical protein